VIESPMAGLSDMNEYVTIQSILKDLPDKITFKELRRIRNRISQGFQETTIFPGISTGGLRLLSKAGTLDMQASILAAPTPELSGSIGRALAHFRNGHDKFETDFIARVLRHPNQGGSIVGADVLPNLMLSAIRGGGSTRDAMEVISMLGAGSEAVLSANRAVIKELMVRAKLPYMKDNIIGAQDLNILFSKIPDDLRFIMFGGKEKQMQLAINELAAQQGLIKLEDIDMALINVDMGLGLKNIFLKETEAQEKFLRLARDAQIFKNLQKAGNPEVIVSRITHLPNADITNLMARLPDPAKEAVRQRLLVQMMARSSRAVEAEEAATAFLLEEVPAGTTLEQVLQTGFAKTPDEAMRKLRIIFGKEQVTNLKDLGLLQALRRQRRSAAQAVGGLAAGSVIANMISFNLKDLPRVIMFRGFAHILTNKHVVKRLSTIRKMKNSSKRSLQFQAVLPEVMEILEEAGFTHEVSTRLSAATVKAFTAADKAVKKAIPALK